jgi:hypothetical protein
MALNPRFAGAAVLVLLAFALAAACSGSKSAAPTATPMPPEPSPTASASPTPGPSPTVTPTPRPIEGTRPFPEDLHRRAEELLVELAQVRNETPKQDVPMFLISRDDAITSYENELEESRDEFALTDAVYKLLGLIPEDSNTLDSLLGILRFGILGFYSTDHDSFYLVDDVESTWESTIVHEFAHALQDQYHDLDALDDEREGDWDALQAVTSVHEGDAVATEWALQGDAARPMPDCFEVPPDLSFGLFPYAIYRELNSWYDDGFCFVNDVFPDQPGRIYEKLPSTMEQVLHPDKYRAGEGARPVDLQDLQAALGSGWEQTDSSTLGEFTVQNILHLGLWDDPDRIWDASTGWGGDRWALYEKDGATLLHLAIVWDSEDEAFEFWDAFVDSVVERSEGSLDATAEDETLFWEGDGKYLYADIDGEAVEIVISADEAAAEAAAASAGIS